MESSVDKEWAQKYLLDPLTAPEPSQVHAHELRDAQFHYSKQRKGDRSKGSSSSSSQANGPLTPPSSASPTSSNFHPSNPYSDSYRSPPNSATRSPAPRIEVSRSPSAASSARPPSYQTHDPSSSEHSRTRPRSSSARITPTHSLEGGDKTHRHRSTHSQQLPQRSASTRHQRNTSLTQRFPGDMSHRPLDILKKENKAADRHPHHRPHRRHRSSVSQTDQIDALDTIGGAYHHGGPYDATLMSRNLEEKYSPLAAVRDSNMEAIRATPKEFIQDSLQKHVPLQGTATVPSGGYDLSGNVMTYDEGADLMREADAPGGAYKRWDGIPYLPEDLKGKGEPSYTIERDAKKMKEREGLLRPEGIEMMAPQRQRSYSNGAAESSGLRVPGGYEASGGSGGVNRSNTTGKKLSEGLKRRFGSMRRKKDLPTESVH